MRYSDVAGLTLDLDPYLSLGVLWTHGRDFPPPLEEFPFRLSLPDGTHFSLRGQILSHVGDNALIQVTNWTSKHYAAAQAAARYRGAPRTPLPAPPRPVTPSLTPQPANVARPVTPQAIGAIGGRAQTPVPRSITPQVIGAIGGRAQTPVPRSITPAVSLASVPASGPLRNPMTIAEMTAQPLRPDTSVGRPPQEPSLIYLARWLGHCRATGILTARSETRTLEVAFRQGRVLIPDRGHDASGDAILWPRASYAFASGNEEELQQARKTSASWNWVVGLLKRWLREQPMDVLREALPETRAPLLHTRGRDLLAALDLTGTELRFSEHRLDGQSALCDLYHAAGLSDLGTARLVAMLHLLEFLEWQEAPERHAETPEEKLVRLYERRAGGSHFQALGVHYSSAPSQIRAAYHAFTADYGVKSAAHEVSAEYAGRMIDLAHNAWAVLGDKASRQQYRNETLKVNAVACAQLLFDQAKMVLLRGEVTEATEMLEEAIDLDPQPEYRAQQAKIAPRTKTE
ncbi:MAG: hypothetical protein EXR72_07340 [Myxococcales bacterium]|nr:hypothetical protein [Myxococcales bacterium]